MIMAGRGKRLVIGDKQKNADTPGPGSVNETADLSKLKEKISQLNLTDTNFPTLTSICNLFNELCSSKETMSDTLNELHDKALSEAEFGEKLVIVLEQIANLEADAALLRGELLTLVQNDFEVKDTLRKSDPKKFVNAVKFLGAVYNRFKICGAPIAVLGIALLDYFDLLLDGGEEELKTLTKQILLNGKTLSEAPTYDQFKVKMRNLLINDSTKPLSKCWLLLIIDLISNDLRPLKGPVNEFYTLNLKDDYIKLESCPPIVSSELRHSPAGIKSEDNIFPKNNQFKPRSQNVGIIKKGLNKKLSDFPIKSEAANFKGKKDKEQISPGKNPKRENLKENIGRGPSISGHDDRFIKEENYYGVQLPRQPKSENRKLASCKSKQKEFNESEANQHKHNS